jgi:hypothetical protein
MSEKADKTLKEAREEIGTRAEIPLLEIGRDGERVHF